MEDETSNISESPEHIVKLEYVYGGKTLVKTWAAQKDENILETTFSAGGKIIDRHLFKKGKGAREHAEEFVEAAGLTPREGVYEPVLLNHACMKCGLRPLSIDESEPASVLPLYVCGSCGAKNYLLTKEYAEKLISRNIGMFSETELESYTKNPEEFIKDLMANINRMFAAKHIYEIK